MNRKIALITGVTTPLRDFVTWSFEQAGILIDWQGRGLEKRGIDRTTGGVGVAIDPRYFRPTEVGLLPGDASKTRQQLGWSPLIIVKQLAAEMAQADFKVMQSSMVMKEA